MKSVSEVLRDVHAANAGAFVSAPLAPGTRAAIEQLFAAYGFDGQIPDMARVSDTDLVALHGTAKGSTLSGAAYANKLVAKHAHNPLFDVPKSMPAPFNPAPPSAPIGDYVMRRDWMDKNRELRDDIRSANDAIANGEKRTLGKVTEVLLQFADAMPSQIGGHLDTLLPEAVKSHVAEALKSLTPVTLNVVRPSEAPVPLGIVHRMTPRVVRYLAAGVNVYLHGPAGSGKTTVGRKAAEAFKLPFYFAAKVESEYMLLGFKDARGETVRTQFREAYEHGGVFLFDELDGSSPSAVVALNAALANGICPFPDGIIMRHENFKCIGAGNTKLSGASREYVGRNQLDAASIDRFAFIEFNYDDALETALASNSFWCKYVQDARRAVAERALKHLITPRATYDGCKLLESGDTWDEAAEAVLWKGLDASTVEQIKRAMKVKQPTAEGIL